MVSLGVLSLCNSSARGVFLSGYHCTAVPPRILHRIRITQSWALGKCLHIVPPASHFSVGRGNGIELVVIVSSNFVSASSQHSWHRAAWSSSFPHDPADGVPSVSTPRCGSVQLCAARYLHGNPKPSASLSRAPTSLGEPLGCCGHRTQKTRRRSQLGRSRSHPVVILIEYQRWMYLLRAQTGLFHGHHSQP